MDKDRWILSREASAWTLGDQNKGEDIDAWVGKSSLGSHSATDH